MNNNIRYLEPEIREYKSFKGENLAIAVLMSCLLISGFILILFLFSFDLIQKILVALITLVCYAIFLFFLLEPKSLREVTQKIIETVENPVYREIYLDRPVVKEVPVIREIVRNVPVPEYREVIKPVYIERKRKKLNIPKYKFLGSTETKTYHLRSCRFGKLIKRKYKVSNNSKKFFTSKKFKACKMCISKSRKFK